MRLLVDTHAWLWFLLTPDRLAESARDALSDRRNRLWLSVASEWEVVIKFGLGRLVLPELPSVFLPSRLAATDCGALPVEQRHILHLENLPMHHRDPFDRILIAQALTDDLVIVTGDPAFPSYDVPLVWAARYAAP